MALRVRRITLISSSLVLFAVLVAGIGISVFIHNLEATALQQRANSNAQLLTTRVSSFLKQQQAIAQQVAIQTSKLGLLDENRPTERLQFAAQIAAVLPQVLKLRILTTGPQPIDKSEIPQLSYACLDLLNRDENGQKPPQAEMHMDNSPSAHIDVFAPVKTETNPPRVLAHVLLSLDPAAIRKTLTTLKSEDGYAELSQITPPNGVLQIAAGGDVNLKNRQSPVMFSVPDTNWRISYWPAAMGSLAQTDVLLAIVMGLLVILLLILSVVLPSAWLSRALKHDRDSLHILFKDIRAGALVEQYPFRFKEFGDLANTLRAAGAQMIQERQALEKKVQQDSLTGLASAGVFMEKLEHLHGQARIGLVSVILLAEIDQLKAIYSKIGTNSGDLLLKQFGRQLRMALRQSDLVAHLGNGRYAVLFPFTDLEKIQQIAVRLRTYIADELDSGKAPPETYTWSAGLTLVAPTDKNSAETLARAEAALLQARKEGGQRNVTLAPPS